MAEELAIRTERFAKDVRRFVRALPRSVAHVEDAKQFLRSSGSVAANQIEADNPLGARDRIMKFRTCRKEARESGLWLRLFELEELPVVARERERLEGEVRQLVAIYSAIIAKLDI